MCIYLYNDSKFLFSMLCFLLLACLLPLDSEDLSVSVSILQTDLDMRSEVQWSRVEHSEGPQGSDVGKQLTD